MEELVWRKEGERCERSYRQLSDAQAQQIQAQQIQAQQIQAQQTQAHAQQTQAQQIQAQAQQIQAQQTQPSEYNDTNFINRHEVEGFRQNNNKREQANSKINERFLIGKSTQNPFMTSNSYNDDIEVQMNFLTPQKGDI
jgi:protein-serine/threonine kinase